MAQVQLSDVSLAWGNRDILLNVNLTITTESRIALAGANGSGKTTLLRIIQGQQQPDSGTVSVQKGTILGALAQTGICHAGRSLRQEAELAFERWSTLQAEMEQTTHRISACPQNDPSLPRLLELHYQQQETLEQSGYYQREALIQQVCGGLGFDRADLDRMTDAFSGGWQMRIALAKVLLAKPDILLLDEPTNYLDLEARTWLEEWLRDSRSGFILVSHDRYFLDVTTTETVELLMGRLTRYRGNFSAYERQRRLEMETLLKAHEEREEEIRKHEEFIRRFRYNSSKAALVQSRVRMLEKLEPIIVPETLKRIHFRFPPAPASGRIMVESSQLSRSWDAVQALRPLDLAVERGTKLVVTGKNGAGKSTLLRILAGVDTGYNGSLSFGKDVSVGYYAQDHDSSVPALPVMDAVAQHCPTDLLPDLRNLLGAFLFRGDDVYKSCTVLSGGELSRLMLVRLLLQPHNLLILDEPTNHLDMHSKDVLLDALRAFEGTIIFVSHDRSFIEGLATEVLELSQGKARRFLGDYRYYQDRLAREAAGLIEAMPGSNPSPPLQSRAEGSRTAAGTAPVMTEPRAGQAKQHRENQKQLQAAKRRLERLENELLEQIDALEQRIASLEQELATPAVYTDGEKVKLVTQNIAQNREALEAASAQWEETSRELSELEGVDA